ncbi:MAG: hypothetical protein LBN42_03025 [Oscillospiraceae bacterium]|jgi:hypothetical protein|nr:hypothetical protein [Oscillospiraceae bacterium]
MASTIDMKTAGNMVYEYLLSDLLKVKYEQPEFYDTFAKIVNDERSRLARTFDIDNLPPVPTKDEK